ncbi:hypothetical protein ACQKWADRAFT_306812 [Trichoderma austrokoningii]
MSLGSRSEANHLLAFFFTSLGTIKEITDVLCNDETELDSRSLYCMINGRCSIIRSQAAFVTDLRDDERTNLVRSILGRLDSLFDLTFLPSTDNSGFPSFPRMRAFNNLWASFNKDEKASKLQWIKEHLDFGSRKEQNELLTSLKRYEDVFIPEPSGSYSAEERPARKQRSEPSYASLFAARSLFQALEVTGKCSCHTYGARFCIKTHRDSDLGEEYDFNLFLEIDQRWQEAHFLAVTKSQSGVSFAIEDDSHSGPRMIPRIERKRVKKLCVPIKRIQKDFPTYKLKFLVEDDKLWKLQSEPSNFASGAATHTITLQRFMTEESHKLTEKTKRILAVLLGYAILHLHETPWLSKSWGPDDILFLRTSSGTPLRPFIELQFGKNIDNNVTSSVANNHDGDNYNNNDDDDDCDGDDDDDVDPDDIMFHPYPSLVALAAMLIELHLARRLQTIALAHNLEYNEDMNDCAKYVTTVAIFGKYKNDISEQTRQAIDMCLNPDINLNEDGNKLSAFELRSVIYRNIVSRLEYELEQTFSYISIETLDLEAQKLDLTKWGRPIVPKKVIPNWNTNGAPSQLADRKRKSHALENHAQKTVNHGADFKFFDDQTSPLDTSSAARNAYASWKTSFCSVYDRFVKGNNPGSVPVKIAVLDTGIDKDHPDYEAQQERIKATKLFSSDGQQSYEDVSDRCGHGTHVAGILLDFAPDAELYIAKISDFEPAEPAIIAKAIDHAVNVWKVDVISMSFGYPSREVNGYGLLERSIKHAINQNVLLFAAASNNGANTKRAYPARHADVICVHSTNANGTPSDFNPTPLPGDNFATIGEAVESAWPVNLCDQEKNENYIAHKSGTSFATPIASGIAAFLLQYARAKLPPKEAEQLKQSHFMKAALKAVSVTSLGFDYIAPSLHPDNAFGKGEASLQSRIRDAMKDV